MQHDNRNFRRQRIALGVAAALLGTSLSTQALEFEFDDRDFRIDWDTNITYGAMWRVQSGQRFTSESTKT